MRSSLRYTAYAPFSKRMRLFLGVILLTSLPLWAAPDQAAFDRDVKPIISKTCTACHNASLLSGGVNLTEFTSAATVASNRAAWEKILQKVRSGEMPPKGIPRPPKMDAMVAYLEGEFDKAFERIQVLGLEIWADPMRKRPGEINHNDGGRGVYFNDPDGHFLELITRPYGSGG